MPVAAFKTRRLNGTATETVRLIIVSAGTSRFIFVAENLKPVRMFAKSDGKKLFSGFATAYDE